MIKDLPQALIDAVKEVMKNNTDDKLSKEKEEVPNNPQPNISDNI